MPEQTAPLLTLEGVKTYYPIRKGIFSRNAGFVKAVDGVDLTICPGETVGLVGESGCGKSTVGRSIIRLEKTSGGRILFEGEDITRLSQRQFRKLRPNIQMVFQDPYSSLNPRRTIGGMLAEVLRAHHIVPEREIDHEIDRLLGLVGMPVRSRHSYPHEFSGGQRQRISIVRALALRPKLIICDEAVSALDVSIQAQILNLLKELQAELGLAYLFISHGLGPVKYISDRIAVMYLGKIVETGTREELFSDPRHPYTKALLSCYPIPNPHKRDNPKIVLSGNVPSPVAPPSGCRFHQRCPNARPECAEREPQLRGCGHLAACHFV